jgi:hypothetical protein
MATSWSVQQLMLLPSLSVAEKDTRLPGPYHPNGASYPCVVSMLWAVTGTALPAGSGSGLWLLAASPRRSTVRDRHGAGGTRTSWRTPLTCKPPLSEGSMSAVRTERTAHPGPLGRVSARRWPGDGSSLGAGACREAQPAGLPGRREPPDLCATRRLIQVRRHGSGGRGRRPAPGCPASSVTTAFSRNRRLCG